MYIPMGLVILGLVLYVVYSIYKLNRTAKVLNDLVRSYDQVTTHLMSYYLHTCKNKKDREEAIQLCARAILSAAGQTVTTKSLLSTTDILSMCKVFQSSFKMREKLTHPYYEFDKEYDAELEKIQEKVAENIRDWIEG